MKKALILDLDNTIYPVSSIAAGLFETLFSLVDRFYGGPGTPGAIAVKDELSRKHFHIVADRFNFDPELWREGIELLKNMEYTLPMQTFDEYPHIKSIPLKKFLVTTGFTKLQWSKVRLLNIEQDFAEIHIVDPEISNNTKKDVFADILKRHNYDKEDVLVIGDDPESEIKAATELGIDTFLFDPAGKHADALITYRSGSLKDLAALLS